MKLPITALKLLCYRCDRNSNLHMLFPPKKNGTMIIPAAFSRAPSLLTRFSVPPDGMPCVKDWVGTWESMIMAGVDLGREPLSVNARHSIP